MVQQWSISYAFVLVLTVYFTITLCSKTIRGTGFFGNLKNLPDVIMKGCASEQHGK